MHASEEGRESKALRLLAEQDGKSGFRVHARGFTPLRELVVHRAGKLLESGDALVQPLADELRVDA